jgi:hypothetical protein
LPSLQSLVTKVARLPSVTTWTRIEPLPREGSMQRSLQAQIRDGLWMIARQWQVGEFLGDDAGSPVDATVGVEARSITTFRPGTSASASGPIDPKLPVEVHVEREPVALRMRGSVQLGLYFENLVRKAGVANSAAIVAAFRAVFPIAAAPPDPGLAPNDALRFRSAAAGRVTDGEALYQSAKATAAGTPATPALPAEAASPGMNAVLAALVQYRDSLFSEPTQDSAWQTPELDYEFAIGSPVGDQNLQLHAPDFPGGHLDWYSFNLESARPDPVGTANPAEVTSLAYDLLPNRVVFRGMPDPRWWNFEDGVTDFGQLDAEHVDLAKLLVMEFALIYGSDWFSVPVPMRIGSLGRVTTLVVTDTFGVRTIIRPSEQTVVNPGETPWSMYKLSGNGVRSDFITMAPTLGLTDDAAPIEEVLFLRDDMAAMAWAVENSLQSDLDAPLDAFEMYLERIKTDPPPAPPVATPNGPKVYYTIERPVPDNWIPMVPVHSPQGQLLLRRGTMEIPTAAGLQKLRARAEILEPEHPLFLADRVVPRAGVLVDRYFRRTRSPDGTTLVWMARKTGVGKGSGWSGLQFDLVRKMSSPPG